MNIPGEDHSGDEGVTSLIPPLGARECPSSPSALFDTQLLTSAGSVVLSSCPYPRLSAFFL